MPSGTSIFEAARHIGVKIRSECGGRGVCAKCIVLVSDPSSVSAPVEFEDEKIGREKTLGGKRLACLTKVLSDTKVQIPKESRIGRRRVQVEGFERSVELNPNIVKIPVKVDLPALDDLRSDLERVLDAVKNRGIEVSSFDYRILHNLPTTLRESSGEVVAIIMNGEELIGVDKKGSTSTFGFAVDIGTSKIVAILVDLETGKSLASGFVENPQMIFGEDIISRISYAMSNRSGLHELQRALMGGIEEAIQMALRNVRASKDGICELVVVGNTAMHHLFLGLNPKWLALAPYVPTVNTAMELEARGLGLKMRKHVRVFLPPVIAGFVGSDAVADLLALELHKSDKNSLALDIGTNTEVFLASQGQVLCCSCASGPAFEGVHISHGMKAVSGAIERIKIDSKGRVSYQTIDEEKPKGLCGSGVVDLVAGLLRRNFVDRSGRFKGSEESERIRRREGILEFLVEEKKNTSTDQDIVFTQPDLRAVQLAKTAIQSGWKILLGELGLKPSDLEAVYLAGAFGNFLDSRSAKEIGLVPDVGVQKISFVGNTAISGAKMALLSLQERKNMAALASQTRYLELGAHSGFNEVFTNSLSF